MSTSRASTGLLLAVLLVRSPSGCGSREHRGGFAATASVPLFAQCDTHVRPGLVIPNQVGAVAVMVAGRCSGTPEPRDLPRHSLSWSAGRQSLSLNGGRQSRCAHRGGPCAFQIHMCLALDYGQAPCSAARWCILGRRCERKCPTRALARAPCRRQTCWAVPQGRGKERGVQVQRRWGRKSGRNVVLLRPVGGLAGR